MKVVCLANSYKEKGYCFAGKDLDTGRWVRPVSTGNGGPLFFRSVRVPKLLDIVNIPEGDQAATVMQPENIIVREENWKCSGKFPASQLCTIADDPADIWMRGYLQDRVSRRSFNEIPSDSSLMFVRVNELLISSYDETYNGYTRRKVRAAFDYWGIGYNLCVTDPDILGHYSRVKEGKYSFKNRGFYLTLSLGLEFRGYCYKLAASIMAA